MRFFALEHVQLCKSSSLFLTFVPFFDYLIITFQYVHRAAEVCSTLYDFLYHPRPKMSRDKVMLEKFFYVTILQCIDKLHSGNKKILFTSRKLCLHIQYHHRHHSSRSVFESTSKSNLGIERREMATNDK